ncbi:hypothetical protein F5B22DRAFT_656033 [Xylaria bambusicola]|uniref:uncharacterized protein n=1 Tax=Xylaria bambusicola TaxID=326684 RepID=UPI002007ABCF|nr:uncharacterized protein F5B22DRAFT_656033 [Xylaria bambusicola]KAI0515339.1 hypothetical protein F5B22DRAFT_656033 [Xylaria bambusicola]
MAEPLSWLKLGPRARTPTNPLTANSSECKATRDSQPCGARRPGSSRTSACTPPECGHEPASADDSVDDLLIRDQDQVWYNPSLNQMVEALQVLLLHQGLFEPIPIRYNSYVLHLIEGYAKSQGRIRSVEAAHQETKQSLEQNIEQLRHAANYWLERESQYRAEVKRLEVLLSKCSKNGLEAVTLARTNSVVDRNVTEGAELLSRLATVSKPHSNDPILLSAKSNRVAGQNRAKRIPTPRILDNDHDFRVSQKIRQQDAARKSAIFFEDRKIHCRRRNSHTESDLMNIHHDGFYNPFVDFQDAHNCQGRRPLANAYEHYAVSTGSPESSHHRKDISNTPAMSVRNLSVCVEDSAHTNEIVTDGIGAACQHERNHSDFSFEAGDDYDALPKKPVEEEKGLEDSYPENAVVRKHQRYSSDTDGLATVSAPVEEQTLLVKENSPSIQTSLGDYPMRVTGPTYMPIRRCRDLGHNSPTAVGRPPGQSNCSVESLAVTAATNQEASQTNKTNARIAARLALANILDTTKQRK